MTPQSKEWPEPKREDSPSIRKLRSVQRAYIVVVNLTVESSFLSATFAISQLEQSTFVRVATSINILDGRDCL